MRAFYKFCKESAKITFSLLFGFEIINKERLLDSKSILIVANHISWFDPPILGSLIPFEIAFLAKAELFNNKFSCWLLENLNSIPLIRSAPDKKAISTVLDVLSAGKSLLLFPEGTRGGKRIKPGVGMFAINTKKDILPIYLENSDDLKSCLFSSKKIKVIIGEKISYEHFSDWEPKKENYQKLADYSYQKIMELQTCK